MLNFFMKNLLKGKLKAAGVPEAETERLLKVIEENPDFFKNIAEKVQQKVSAGMNQEEAIKSILGEEGAGAAKLFRA
jgi:hypothetical protein